MFKSLQLDENRHKSSQWSICSDQALIWSAIHVTDEDQALQGHCNLHLFTRNFQILGKKNHLVPNMIIRSRDC